MGKERPERLGQKLAAIRKALDLSQNEIVRRLGMSDRLTREEISAYERGVREPSLPTLLLYSRVAGVHLEDIVDDELDLPDKLPGNVRYKGIKRKAGKKPR
jgi:transcriptional regulator with XRE-family HTH domain